MAWTSGALSTSNDKVKYTITIDEKSTNVTNNTSNVTVSVRFYRTNTGYTTYGSGTVYCTINGTRYTAAVSSSQKITNSGIVLFSKNLNIGHDSNGAKTLTVSASISISGVLSSSSQSYSHALTTIPRASGLTVGNGTLGTKQTITADRKSSSFTHTLSWKCGSYSGTIASKSTATSWSFTPELKLATGAPYGTGVYCDVTLTTYNGNTSVGSATKRITLAIPASVKPTVSSLSFSDSKGYLYTYGGYIQGQSVVNVTVNATQAQGSPINSYSTVIDGSTYTGKTFNTTIRSSGTVDVKATVKDGRGRSSDQLSTNITVLPYSVPKITKLSVKRCNQDGADNDRGGYAAITISYSITSLNDLNSKSVSLKYKKTSDEEWTNASLTASYSASDQVVIVAADDAHSYDIQLTVQDSFATTLMNTSVSTGYCLYHIPASGKGITFGGVAEDDGFNVKMDAHFHNGITEDIPVISADCNELLTSGKYYIGNGGTTTANKPDGYNGWLTVKAYEDAQYCYQEYVTISGMIYKRWRNAGTWGNWIREDGQKILWEGLMVMGQGQTAQLSEKITAQKSGIVLMFGEYSNNAWAGTNITCGFIPKTVVTKLSGAGYNFNLTNPWRHAHKYLYISDSSISGNSNNSITHAVDNVTYINGMYVLRWVIGV